MTPLKGTCKGKNISKPNLNGAGSLACIISFLLCYLEHLHTMGAESFHILLAACLFMKPRGNYGKIIMAAPESAPNNGSSHIYIIYPLIQVHLIGQGLMKLAFSAILHGIRKGRWVVLDPWRCIYFHLMVWKWWSCHIVLHSSGCSPTPKGRKAPLKCDWRRR